MTREDPLLRIVRGVPTPDELAALVGVLFARARPADQSAPAPPSAWRRSARPGALTAAGLPPRPERDGWRRSALPR